MQNQGNIIMGKWKHGQEAKPGSEQVEFEKLRPWTKCTPSATIYLC